MAAQDSNIHASFSQAQHDDDDDDVDLINIHTECMFQCRETVILKYIHRYPEALAISDKSIVGDGNLPLHSLLSNMRSATNAALTMIEKYPTALYHPNNRGQLPLHMECQRQCRSFIISKCIELNPNALSHIDISKNLPLHFILRKHLSSVEDALMMIEKYPAALQHPNQSGELPIHVECKLRNRSSIMSKCIELYPESLSKADVVGNLPLHLLLQKDSSSNYVLMMIGKYPAALSHSNYHGQIPLHIECGNRCRSAVIAKCIEQYPEALSTEDADGYLPLHVLLKNESSSVKDALTMIKKYPTSLKHQIDGGFLGFYTTRCWRIESPILTRCLELHSEALNDETVFLIMTHINKHNWHDFSSVLSIVFTTFPMSLYHDPETHIEDDIRKDPHIRRRILNGLLPRHVFTPTHEVDYRHLNWQPREAMMMLFSQMKQ
jgi:ankyrin repeat protein